MYIPYEIKNFLNCSCYDYINLNIEHKIIVPHPDVSCYSYMEIGVNPMGFESIYPSDDSLFYLNAIRHHFARRMSRVHSVDSEYDSYTDSSDDEDNETWHDVEDNTATLTRDNIYNFQRDADSSSESDSVSTIE